MRPPNEWDAYIHRHKSGGHVTLARLRMPPVWDAMEEATAADDGTAPEYELEEEVMVSKRQEQRALMCLGKKTFRCEEDAEAEIEAYEQNANIAGRAARVPVSSSARTCISGTARIAR